MILRLNKVTFSWRVIKLNPQYPYMLTKNPHFVQKPTAAGLNPSIFFFTFHKCASAFFSRHVLPYARGLNHVDSARRRVISEGAFSCEFSPRAHLYGPLRLSASGEVFEYIIKPAMDIVVRDKLPACLMIRDPRDMLVSQFFQNRHIKCVNPKLDAIQFGIDKYTIKNTQHFLDGFNRAAQLIANHPTTLVLRYEDMVNNWNIFKDGLSKVFDICPKSLLNIERESRPNLIEQLGQHKRSGVTGGYRHKLSKDTIAILTKQFYPFLEKFGYLSDHRERTLD